MGSLFIYKPNHSNTVPSSPPLCSKQALISEEFQREDPYETFSSSRQGEFLSKTDHRKSNDKNKTDSTICNMNNSITRVTLLLENLKGQLHVAVSANTKYSHLIFFLENRNMVGKCTLALLNTTTMQRIDLISSLGLSRVFMWMKI